MRPYIPKYIEIHAFFIQQILQLFSRRDQMASETIDAECQAQLAETLARTDRHGTTIETYQIAEEVMIRVVSSRKFHCMCCWCVVAHVLHNRMVNHLERTIWRSRLSISYSCTRQLY